MTVVRLPWRLGSAPVVVLLLCFRSFSISALPFSDGLCYCSCSVLSLLMDGCAFTTTRVYPSVCLSVCRSLCVCLFVLVCLCLRASVLQATLIYFKAVVGCVCVLLAAERGPALLL
jgi:hypothetical protein